MAVRRLDMKYRGFEIGYSTGAHGLLAAWRSSLDDDWRIGCVYVDTVKEVPDLARECIDFICRVDCEEIALGRRLSLEEVSKLRAEQP